MLAKTFETISYKTLHKPSKLSYIQRYILMGWKWDRNYRFLIFSIRAHEHNWYYPTMAPGPNGMSTTFLLC